MHQAYPIMMEVSGPTAMWTRPDTGDSPVSYPAPTYSAVRGIFSSILWGPAIEIIPIKVEICEPIEYHSYSTNYGGPLRSNIQIKNGNNYQMFATVLIDVCYRLYAEVVPYKDKARLPKNALAWDKQTSSPGHAYQSIFKRRLQQGAYYQVPCFGLKEFTVSYVGEFRDGTSVQTNLPDIHISSMLREVFNKGYDSSVSYSYDTNLVIQGGVLHYPTRGTAYDK